MEAYGFKSFADKVELNFDEGITGIVGPNGCGKSNISDAIRWVLGEQSARALRGSNMQDVIFNGAETRKQLSYCEVSLYFDNSSGIFPIEYSEVVFSRKLYRSGESEYAINKKPCRMKDMLDLMRGAGIAKDGYSIIGQGRVDELITSKAEDRRSIFDEATGIAKFKIKKNETERKLARTRENLTRYNDILSEIERQLEPLRKQAETTKKYLALRDELKYNEINSFIYRYENANDEKAKIAVKIAGYDEELAERQGAYDEVQKEYEQHMSSISDTDVLFNDLRDKQLELSLKMEKTSGESKLYRERINLILEQNKRLEGEIASLSEEYTSLLQQLKEKNVLNVEKNNLLSALTAQEKTITSAFIDVANQLSSAEDFVELGNSAVVDSINDLSDVKADFWKLESQRTALIENTQENLSKIAVLQTRIENARAQRKKMEDSLREIETQCSSVREESKKIPEEIASINEELIALQREGNELAKRRAADDTRLEFLQKTKESFEGYNYPVKRFLNDAKFNPSLARRFNGVVAQLIDVPSKFQVAIECALGQAMQNIVTPDIEDAKHLINYLKDKRYGRITFLPITTVKPRQLADRHRGALKMNGCLGVASDLISYDRKYDNVISCLLGGTVIVDTIDNAIAISKAYRSEFKIVTLQGEIFATSGSVSGGSRKEEGSNLLSVDRDIETLNQDKVKIEARIKKIASEMGALNERLSILTAKESEQRIRLHRMEIDVATGKEVLSKADSAISDYQAAIDGHVEDNRRNELRIEDIAASLERIKNKEENLKQSKTETESDVRAKKEAFDQLRSSRESLNQSLTDVKVRIAEAQSEVQALSEEIRRLTIESGDVKESLERAEKQLRVNNEIIDAAEKSASNSVVSEEDRLALEDIKAKLQDLDQFKKDLNQKLIEVGTKKDVLTAEIQRLTTRRNNEEFNMEKIDNDLQVMQEKIFEDYQYDFEDALKFKDEEFVYAKSASLIKSLRGQIYALGSVNVNAIDDFEALNVRYTEMNEQRNDMQEAEADLKKVLEDLTTEMVTKFDSEFVKINENFKTTFRELFGGGRARLSMVENESGDRLSYGIEIEAEPPGKVLQNITLLSGGEKALTAIAILFAILKLRPMPFCVLDEIEAALDEANAFRLAKYLKDFSQRTQFIIITHQKQSMEVADALYGVTMQEKGVSKIISVKLSDIKE